MCQEVNLKYVDLARQSPIKKIIFHEYYLTTKMFAFNETLDGIKLDGYYGDNLKFLVKNKLVDYKDLSISDKKYLAVKIKEFNK